VEGGLGGDDGHTAVSLVELDRAILEGKEGPIAAGADVLASVQLGAALTDDDIASNDLLAAKDLNAEALAVAVATVAGGSLSFLMCHGSGSFLDGDGVDLDDRKLLAMALLLFVALALLFLEDNDFGSALVFKHGSLH